MYKGQSVAATVSLSRGDAHARELTYLYAVASSYEVEVIEQAMQRAALVETDPEDTYEDANTYDSAEMLAGSRC